MAEERRRGAAVRVISVLLWIVATAGAGFGAVVLVTGVVGAAGAPQEAAAAAIAAACAVIPYVIARAWDEMTRP